MTATSAGFFSVPYSFNMSENHVSYMIGSSAQFYYVMKYYSVPVQAWVYHNWAGKQPITKLLCSQRRLRWRTMTLIRLRIRAVWSESSLSTWRCFESLTIHCVPCEDSGQTVRMRRLIWAFARRTCNLIGNAVPRLIRLIHDPPVGSRYLRFRLPCIL